MMDAPGLPRMGRISYSRAGEGAKTVQVAMVKLIRGWRECPMAGEQEPNEKELDRCLIGYSSAKARRRF